jgi:hypothetical protein
VSGSIRREKPGLVVYICNPSTQEAKAGRSQVQDQPELHSETEIVFQKAKCWGCNSVVKYQLSMFHSQNLKN